MTEQNGVERSIATKHLRELLTERGAEWHRTPHYSSESIDNETVFRGEGIDWIANDHLNGHIGLRALRYEVTPEQAVEATLGREPDDAAMVKLHERMNAALLEYERAQGIEMRDGDAAVTVPFVAKMHELLEEAATLGRGTCYLISAPQYGEGCQECSACGEVMDGYLFDGGHCPRCGAKVVDK